MKAWLAKFGEKLIASNRMIYVAGYCWWTIIAFFVWSKVGYTEATFATFVFVPMTTLFGAAIGLKTYTDQKKIPNGDTPKGGTK